MNLDDRKPLRELHRILVTMGYPIEYAVTLDRASCERRIQALRSVSKKNWRKLSCNFTIRDSFRKVQFKKNWWKSIGRYLIFFSMECAICLSTLSSKHRILPCKHRFHVRCIKSWLSISSSCPCCRASVETHRPPSTFYDVESITDRKYRRGTWYYRVKWLDYGVEHSTWEPEYHLRCDLLVSEYETKHPRPHLRRSERIRSLRVQHA